MKASRSPAPSAAATAAVKTTTASTRLLSLMAAAWLGLAAAQSTSTSCMPLSGIERGGGEGILDLDVVEVSLAAEPIDFRVVPVIPTIANCASGLETPVSMRNLLAIDTAAFSLASMFNPNTIALDIFGDKATSDARRRCQPTTEEETALFDLHLRVAILYVVAYGGLTDMPYCFELVDPLMTGLSFPLDLVMNDDEPDVSTPWGLAKAYFDETYAYLGENDGWNSDGSANREYNRVPYSDYAITDSDGNSWEPFVPRNTPYKFSNYKKWQPLVESNNMGYLRTQEHVTPHIGAVGRFYGFETPEDEEDYSSRKLPRASYRNRRGYKRASEDVLEETRITASDESGYRAAAISFFDNKFASLVPLKISYFLTPTTTRPIIDFYTITVSSQLAMYNSVLLVWKEKIRQNMPRPPSVVRKFLGDEEFETYAGEGQGVKTIKASEWEPYIRTMPHAEYPSASSCMCQVFAEQLSFYFGEDEIDPPIEVGPPLLSAPATFSSWSEVSQVCGDSRFWGGMHFEDAVPGGQELCGGTHMAESIQNSIFRLIAGDEDAAVFKSNPGELKVREI